MHKTFVLICLCLSLLLAAHMPLASAAQITKQQAANIANSQFQGRIIAVDETKQDGAAVYRVKVLDKSGGMHTVIVDMQTGNVISAH